MRRIERDERRARLGRRHWLAQKAPDAVAVAGDLAGLHSSDPATVYLSAQARVQDFQIGDMEDALYRAQSLIRMHAMRRTMFVVPVTLAPILDAAITQKVEATEKKRLAKMLEEQGLVKNGMGWINRVSKQIIGEVHARGATSTSELSEAIPGLKSKTLRFGEGTKWQGKVAVTTRVMFLVAMTGEVVRGRPAGTWVSSQYSWLPGVRITGRREEDAAARADLIRLWLQAYGPGTMTDLRWWSSLTVTHVRRALADLDAEEVGLEDGTGYVLSGDKTEPDPGPWVALLPGLDPSVMGWKEREWFLGDHESELFDRNGNAGPTIWADGRIIGGWAQTADRVVRYRLVEQVDSGTSDRVEEAATALTTWLGDVRVSPRFPSPLSRAIAAG